MKREPPDARSEPPSKIARNEERQSQFLRDMPPEMQFLILEEALSSKPIILKGLYLTSEGMQSLLKSWSYSRCIYRVLRSDQVKVIGPWAIAAVQSSFISSDSRAEIFSALIARIGTADHTKKLLDIFMSYGPSRENKEELLSALYAKLSITDPRDSIFSLKRFLLPASRKDLYRVLLSLFKLAPKFSWKVFSPYIDYLLDAIMEDDLRKAESLGKLFNNFIAAAPRLWDRKKQQLAEAILASTLVEQSTEQAQLDYFLESLCGEHLPMVSHSELTMKICIASVTDSEYVQGLMYTGFVLRALQFTEIVKNHWMRVCPASQVFFNGIDNDIHAALHDSEQIITWSLGQREFISETLRFMFSSNSKMELFEQFLAADDALTVDFFLSVAHYDLSEWTAALRDYLDFLVTSGEPPETWFRLAQAKLLCAAIGSLPGDIQASLSLLQC